jgi:hypothetical protein
LGAPAVTEANLRDVVDELVSEYGLTAQQASFDHRDVVRAWCEALPAGTKVTLEALEDLADVVECDERVIRVVDGRAQLAERQRLERADGRVTAAAMRERRWSTTEMLEIERRLPVNADPASVVTGAGGVPAATVERVLAARLDLVDEQAAMARELTTSGRAVDVVVGRAGAGKTYALPRRRRSGGTPVTGLWVWGSRPGPHTSSSPPPGSTPRRWPGSSSTSTRPQRGS